MPAVHVPVVDIDGRPTGERLQEAERALPAQFERPSVGCPHLARVTLPAARSSQMFFSERSSGSNQRT